MKLSAIASFLLPKAQPRSVPPKAAVSVSDQVRLSDARPMLEAPPSGNPDVEVVGRFPSKKWAWTERLFDSDPHFSQANFGPRGRQRSAEIAEAFGSDTPHSGNVLLHYAGAPPAGVARQPHPVVLVHGANKTGEFWWDPHEDGSDQGLPQKLRAEGYEVYFVSFAHPHDDNFVWAEQLANGIERVRQLSGADQVDLVAHSKGGAPARAYVSDMREQWMTPYRGDVRRLLLVGAANGGLDTTFRHASSNLALLSQSDSPLLNAPTSWEKTKFMGLVPIDISAQSYSDKAGDCWPGQDQLLARWDSKYPIAYWEQDSHTTYHGGEGFVSSSKGIDHYIAQGGHYIARLNEARIDPQVEVALLAGDNPNIPGIMNENTGPSDGLLFVDSALHMPSTSNIKAKSVLHLNHKALVSDAEGQQWISDTLRG
ncbi:MAG: acetyltransferase [Candidatus Eremiobacteraeota bacterium]|nr:acetyltransferase [Candidatus Eremiobacteraeota bacterium]